MHDSTRLVWGARGLVLGAALLALGVSCSSSNNNKKSTNNNAAGTAPAATLSAAAPPSPTVARTAAPILGGVSTATARTATPAAGGVLGAAPVAADQQALQAAALKPADLPTGFSAVTAPNTSLTLPGQTASYSAVYTMLGTGGTTLNVQAIVDGLSLFKDTATAQSLFKDLLTSVSQQVGANVRLQPVANGPKLGDETLAYQVEGQASGFTVSGYALIWRRGRAGVALVQVGAPPPPSIDALLPLAQKQDDNLAQLSK